MMEHSLSMNTFVQDATTILREDLSVRPAADFATIPHDGPRRKRPMKHRKKLAPTKLGLHTQFATMIRDSHLREPGKLRYKGSYGVLPKQYGKPVTALNYLVPLLSPSVSTLGLRPDSYGGLWGRKTSYSQAIHKDLMWKGTNLRLRAETENEAIKRKLQEYDELFKRG